MLKNKNIVMKFIRISIFLILSLFLATVVLGTKGEYEEGGCNQYVENDGLVFNKDRKLVTLSTKNDYTALITDPKTTNYEDNEGNKEENKKYNNYIYINPHEFVNASSLDNKASFCIAKRRREC